MSPRGSGRRERLRAARNQRCGFSETCFEDRASDNDYLYSKSFAIGSFRPFGAYWRVMVVMAVRAEQSLVCRHLSGGESDDKGRSARAAKRVAHDSHRKTWLRKHKQLARKLLL